MPSGLNRNQMISPEVMEGKYVCTRASYGCDCNSQVPRGPSGMKCSVTEWNGGGTEGKGDLELGCCNPCAHILSLKVVRPIDRYTDRKVATVTLNACCYEIYSYINKSMFYRIQCNGCLCVYRWNGLTTLRLREKDCYEEKAPTRRLFPHNGYL